MQAEGDVGCAGGGRAAWPRASSRAPRDTSWMCRRVRGRREVGPCRQPGSAEWDPLGDVGIAGGCPGRGSEVPLASFAPE